MLRRTLWPLVKRRARGALTDEELFPYLRDCGIVLGLNQGRDEADRLDSYLKFRDVEFPGYGCCYLTQYNEDVARAFEVGIEIVTFDSMRHAAREIRQLSSDPDRSRRIGRAGRARVLADHTWEVRLRQLAERL
jgi:spore maturation protein CgeB